MNPMYSNIRKKTAAMGCITAALIVIPVGLPSVMIGMYMSVMHPQINSIDALPLYLVTYLPDWLGGIGLGALLISALGSLSGLALGVGTSIVNENVWENRFQYVNELRLIFKEFVNYLS